MKRQGYITIPVGWSWSRWWKWLRESNARVRFHSNGTVEVMVNGRRARHRHLSTAAKRLYARLQGGMQ